MGKKGSDKKAPGATGRPQMSVTIREASTGKKHTNAKSSLKLEHIKNLAVWATRDAAIPSLGAFFSHHFAASSEALGTPIDPSLFICHRCESILHPGYNCTIRIEKNKKNSRRKGKKTTYPQNNIVYTCHFCSYQNMQRGTPRNISQTQVKAHPKSTNRKPASTIYSSGMTSDSAVANNIAAPLGPTTDDPDSSKMGIVDVTDTLKIRNDHAASDPATPLTRPTMTLLESKMKKRSRTGAKKRVASESTSEASNAENSINTSKKRRRKSWTSLKDIAESNHKNNSSRLMNVTVPFSLM